MLQRAQARPGPIPSFPLRSLDPANFLLAESAVVVGRVEAVPLAAVVLEEARSRIPQAKTG